MFYPKENKYKLFYNKMDLKAPVALAITTYEFNNNNYNPIITHIFWGKDLDEAVGYAHSHLKTDFFFSSSFVGEMPWRGSVLILRNKNQIINKKDFISPQERDGIIKDLTQDGRQINLEQRANGILRVIERLH